MDPPPNTNTALPMLPPFLAPFLADARRRRFGAMMRKNPQPCAAERDGQTTDYDNAPS